jgi:flagellar hook-length control protein FliK
MSAAISLTPTAAVAPGTAPEAELTVEVTAEFVALLEQLLPPPVAQQVAQQVAAEVLESVPDAVEPNAEQTSAAAIAALALPSLTALPVRTEQPVTAPVARSLGLRTAATIGALASLSKAVQATPEEVDALLSNQTANASLFERFAENAERSVGEQPTERLAQATSISTTPTTEAAPVDADSVLRERVGTHAWREELSAKLTFLVERGVQSGSLRLNPEHLGPLEVRISVQNDQASVWFGAAHAETRTALEHALPKLRELLAAQGLSLADAGVSREPPRDTARQSATPHAPGYDNDNSQEQVRTVSIVGKAQGLLDTYA